MSLMQKRHRGVAYGVSSRTSVIRTGVIKASEVAACLGKNRFKPMDGVAAEKWKQWFPNEYRTFLTHQKAQHEPLVFDIAKVAKSSTVTRAAQDLSEDMQTIRTAMDAVTNDSRDKIDVAIHTTQELLESTLERAKEEETVAIKEHEKLQHAVAVSTSESNATKLEEVKSQLNQIAAARENAKIRKQSIQEHIQTTRHMRHGVSSKEQIKQLLTKTHDLVVNHAKQELEAQIKQDLAKLGHTTQDVNDKLVQSMLKSAVSCQNGITEEKKAVKLHEQRFCAPIQPKSNAKCFRQTIGVFDLPSVGATQGQKRQIKIDLMGFVDGISADGQLIVEVKNRQQRLFGRMVEYERIQVFVYMFLTKIHKCHFIERFGDESKEYMIEFDQHEWDTNILPDIHEFIQYAIKCVHDDAWKLAILKQ